MQTADPPSTTTSSCVAMMLHHLCCAADSTEIQDKWFLDMEAKQAEFKQDMEAMGDSVQMLSLQQRTNTTVTVKDIGKV